jgi:hypothetical protein
LPEEGQRPKGKSPTFQAVPMPFWREKPAEDEKGKLFILAQ